MTKFARQHAELENEFAAQAAADGDVFIPNIPAVEPVDYIIIAMEPSLGRWANGVADARNKVENGFKNFMYSAEDFLLHFAFSNFLCGERQIYYVTDLSKGAMLVGNAEEGRLDRWHRWHPLLEREIGLVAKPCTQIFALGGRVAEFLASKGSPVLSNGLKNWNGDGGKCPTLLQHSWSASRWRSAAPAAHPQDFATFCDSVDKGDIEQFSLNKLSEVAPSASVTQWMSRRIRNFDFSMSKRKLLFTYKLQLSGVARH